jgi:hypothetical protein
LDLATTLSNEGSLAKEGELTIPAGMTQEAYVADRYKKSRAVLDLMMEKLPVASCPFTVQLGAQVANVYYNLGKVSGDTTSVEKGNKILEDEILHFASYLRFYQSLDPSLYERLTRSDKYIDQQYVLSMLTDYYERCGEQKYEALVAKLEASGVNMQRLVSYQEAYEQRMRQQMQAQQMQAQQQEAEEASSSELGEMLGN